MTVNPRDIGPGYVVRLRCGGGGLSYSSGRMTKEHAEKIADSYEAVLGKVADNDFVRFASEHGEVRIRAQRVTAIEVCRTLLAPDRNHMPAIDEVEVR